MSSRHQICSRISLKVVGAFGGGGIPRASVEYRWWWAHTRPAGRHAHRSSIHHPGHRACNRLCRRALAAPPARWAQCCVSPDARRRPTPARRPVRSTVAAATSTTSTAATTSTQRRDRRRRQRHERPCRPSPPTTATTAVAPTVTAPSAGDGGADVWRSPATPCGTARCGARPNATSPATGRDAGAWTSRRCSPGCSPSSPPPTSGSATWRRRSPPTASSPRSPSTACHPTS